MPIEFAKQYQHRLLVLGNIDLSNCVNYQYNR